MEKLNLLLNVKTLSMINTKIYIKFEAQYMNRYKKVVKEIIEKSESKILLNFIFNEDFEELKLKPFSFYENIFINFYAIASTTCFINDKRFFIRFPQLFNEKFDHKNLITIYYNQTEEIEIDENNLLESYNDKEETINIPELKINEIFINKSKLNLLHYDYVALGGSFDHLHIGHNVIIILS
jgi:hypothetical protein